MTSNLTQVGTELSMSSRPLLYTRHRYVPSLGGRHQCWHTGRVLLVSEIRLGGHRDLPLGILKQLPRDNGPIVISIGSPRFA